MRICNKCKRKIPNGELHKVVCDWERGGVRFYCHPSCEMRKGYMFNCPHCGEEIFEEQVD